MSKVPDFQDLIAPLEDPTYPKWDIPFLIAQRLIDRLKAIEVKLDAIPKWTCSPAGVLQDPPMSMDRPAPKEPK